MKKKPIYKALSFFLSLCLIAATITVPAFGAAGDTITITTIGNQTFAAGDSVNIPINYTKSNTSNTDTVSVEVAGLSNTGLAYNNNSSNPAITGTATKGTDTVTVTAKYSDSDNSGTEVSDTETFTITVNDLSLNFDSSETLTAGIAGVSYSQSFTAATTNSTLQQITYTKGEGWNDAFELNDNTISATAPAAGDYTLNVVAKVGSLEKTKACSVKIAAPVITWNPTTTFNDAVVGKNYGISFKSGASTTGNEPITFALKQGSTLPAGLSLSTAGVLSGTPTEAVENATFTITASAPNAAPVDVTFTLTIAARSLTMNAIADQTVTVGEVFSFAKPTVENNTSATPAYSIAVTKNGETSALPSGLTFTDGAISGTIAEENGAAAEGEYQVTITASVDNGAVSASRTFTLTVAYPRVEIGTIENITVTATKNQTVHVAVSDYVTNTTGEYATYSAAGLPDGLQIAQATGAIYGAPAMSALNNGAAKNYTVTVTASTPVNGTNKSDTATFTITVNPPEFKNAPTDLGSQTVFEKTAITDVNVATSIGTTYTGGDAVTYSTTSTLPTGVTLSQAGLLSGTPGAGTVGEYEISIKAESASGIEHTATYTLTVTERKFTLGTLSNDTIKLGADYSKDVKSAFSYSDNNANVTYDVTTTLPAGLSIDKNTGVISGKITNKSLVSETPFEIGVMAKDETNNVSSGEVTYNLTIEGLAFTTFDVPSALEGYAGYTFANSDISAAFEDSTSALTFSATGLPAGLSINASTGAITGTVGANATGGNATVTVTDGTYGYNASKDIAFTVKTPSIAITKPEDVTVYEGYDFSQVIAEATVDVPDSSQIAYSVTGLPNGMSFNSGTRGISGAAEAGASARSPYTISISVTDGVTSKTETFEMTVKAPALIIVNIADIEMYAGNETDIDVTWTYDGPNTASVSVKDLPAGLSYANGKITGAPNNDAVKDNSYTVEVSVTDGVKTATKTFTIKVMAKAEVTPTQQPEELKWDGNTAGENGMEIRFDVPFNKFSGKVYMDGKLLRQGTDFTAKSGSTIITLTNSFLKGLASKNYNIEAIFTDSIGKATVNVAAAVVTPPPTGQTTQSTQPTTDPSVAEPNKPGIDATVDQPATQPTETTTTQAQADEGASPKTGDNNALAILIVLTILAAGATMALYKKRKKA